MTPAELQKILQSDEKLTVKHVKEIIWQLKNDCFEQINKWTKEKKERETIDVNKWNAEEYLNFAVLPYFEERFYNGEANAFYICLDLLEKVEEEWQKLN